MAGALKFEGAVCPSGHTLRYIRTGQCAICAVDLARRYREANPEKHRAASRAWNTKNPERNRAKAESWRRANMPQARVQRRNWKKNNPAYCAADVRLDQARKLQRTPPWADLKEIRRFYETAAEMTAKTGEPWHVDHEIPLRGKLVSGLHVPNNLQLLPGVENLRKGNRFTIEEQYFG